MDPLRARIGAGISIHAPRVGSDGDHPELAAGARISIHAPRVGSDRKRRRIRSQLENFNPRSPRGERPYADGVITIAAVFQSTLPAWGATQAGCRPAVSSSHFNPRSPRGERPFWMSISWRDRRNFNPRSPRGERRAARRRRSARDNFNPRSPRGERLVPDSMACPELVISIHAPRVGSDAVRADIFVVVIISIHAPRVGSDTQRRRDAARGLDFNPRSPRGERQSGSMTRKSGSIFQSTLPAWGATSQQVFRALTAV